MTSRDAMRRFGAAHAALWVPMLALEWRMNRAGGAGIVPFELAGTPERARELMERWGEDGRRAARLSLLLDYPFLVSYTGVQVAGCTAAGELLPAVRVVVALQVAAGAFDAAENTALLGVLSGREGGRLPAVARACALAKFALLGVGWAYALAGLAARLRR
ncbi:MAG TPA: hypothetical protein VH256_00800 [Thermoleophilaceae bacterium]|nr:hypothetical protein [Thermoleophilaceae bacterium]